MIDEKRLLEVLEKNFYGIGGVEDFRTLQELNRDGWFNGIGNLSIKEILDNCEVIDK